MSIDREAALKKAEKLLRQGKLKGAIEEYVRLIEDQPRDVGAINALGDLYIRAGDADRAVAQFTRVGDQLFVDGFLPRAQAIYKKALKVQPHHEHTLSRLAEIADRQGMSADAVTYLRQLAERRRLRGDELGVAECVQRIRALDKSDANVSTSDAASILVHGAAEGIEGPAALLAAAAKELTAGNELQGRAVLMRALALDTARHDDVVRMSLDLLAQGRIETAFGCIDVVADAALLGGSLNQAIEALQTFVRAAPHIPALVKLVELCVDAGLDGPLRAAQTQLADAYLDTGRGAEARVIAEDLLEQDPDCEAHAQRVRRAMELLGAPDADRTVADVRGRHREIDIAVPGEPRSPHAVSELDVVEVDLGDALSEIRGRQPLADDPYDRARKHLEADRIEEGMADLREAARTSPRRVKAAADLGRLHIRRGELQAAVEWLERAADGPADSQDEGFAVLYELADTLEQLGEHARALAILIDLDADAGGYRDVRMRIEQLVRTQTGSQPQ